jgi:hypothetical protein
MIFWQAALAKQTGGAVISGARVYGGHAGIITRLAGKESLLAYNISQCNIRSIPQKPSPSFYLVIVCSAIPHCCGHGLDAMVGKLGTREFFTNTAVGDTVNLLQRREGTAQLGQDLIDQATYSALVDMIVADPLVPILPTGKVLPVTVFTL